MREMTAHPLTRRTLLIMLGACVSGIANAQQAPITVAAAANMQPALQEIAAQYEQTTGQRLRLVFGSSGNFVSQILQGAPFDLFLSADEAFVFKLADARMTLDRGRPYANGRIALFVPKGSPVSADSELKGLARALKAGEVRKFAIANPEHAPYGARAREVLQHADLWRDVQDRLVMGESIAQVAQFATSGGAQAAIIAYALALSPQLAVRGQSALIPSAWHQPLVQRMVLMKNAPPAALAFYEHMTTPAAQATLVRHGYALPQP